MDDHVIFQNKYEECILELYADDKNLCVSALDIVEGVNHVLTRSEAIAAAKAILAYYGEE